MDSEAGIYTKLVIHEDEEEEEEKEKNCDTKSHSTAIITKVFQRSYQGFCC